MNNAIRSLPANCHACTGKSQISCGFRKRCCCHQSRGVPGCLSRKKNDVFGRVVCVSWKWPFWNIHRAGRIKAAPRDRFELKGIWKCAWFLLLGVHRGMSWDWKNREFCRLWESRRMESVLRAPWCAMVYNSDRAMSCLFLGMIIVDEREEWQWFHTY